MSKENKSRFAILGLLHYKPLTGYDIKKWTDTSLNFFWSENYGHIYPLLKELEKEGLAKSKQVGSDKGPARNIFSITSEGRKVFLSWLKSPENPEKYRIEILLKLFFSKLLSLAEINSKLEDQIKEQERLLAEYREVEAHFVDIPDDRMRLSAELTLAFGKSHAQMVIQWARSCLTKAASYFPAVKK